MKGPGISRELPHQPVFGPPWGPVAGMAAQRGVPPMRMLEEALGISLTSSGDAPEPVAADGAYYLERILLVDPGLSGDRRGPRRGFLWGRPWTPLGAGALGFPGWSPC